jgi:hypothetical protein
MSRQASAEIKKLMEQLAAELRRPRQNRALIEKLNRQLDRALGTELQPEDEVCAEVWERSRR